MLLRVRRSRIFSVVASLGLIATGAMNSATPAQAACPCGRRDELTVAERWNDSDVAVIAEQLTPAVDDKKPRRVTYRVKKIIKRYHDALKTGQEFSALSLHDHQSGDQILVMGKQITPDGEIEWQAPLKVNQDGLKYVLNTPAPDVPAQKRLEYYFNFLFSADELIANDAIAEVGGSAYKDIAPLARKLPREKVRAWLTADDAPPSNLALYGLLLGLCGNQDDAKFLEAKVLEKPDDFRMGADGLMSGYLLLTGEKGLTVLENAKLRDKDVLFSETYAAMQALRFMWHSGEGKIAPERLRQSMRILLERPELADLVIADLARWKDWSIQEQLMKMYGEGEFNIPSIRRAIVRYMLVSTKDLPKEAGADAKVPEHVARGLRNLEELRQKDAKTVSEAERFFFPPEK